MCWDSGLCGRWCDVGDGCRRGIWDLHCHKRVVGKLSWIALCCICERDGGRIEGLSIGFVAVEREFGLRETYYQGRTAEYADYCRRLPRR